MAAATEMSVTALAINLLVPLTGARITTNVLVPSIGAGLTKTLLVSLIGACTHQKCAGSTSKTARCTQTSLERLFDVRGALVGS